MQSSSTLQNGLLRQILRMFFLRIWLKLPDLLAAFEPQTLSINYLTPAEDFMQDGLGGTLSLVKAAQKTS